jgi:hypothetical protein
MNKTEINETWTIQKIKLKLKFAALTDSDLWFEKVKREEMVEKLQIVLNKTKEEVEEIIKNL